MSLIDLTHLEIRLKAIKLKLEKAESKIGKPGSTQELKVWIGDSLCLVRNILVEEEEGDENHTS